MGEDVARNAERTFGQKVAAGSRPILPPGSEPTSARLAEALDACNRLTMALAAQSVQLARVERERDQFRDNYLRDAARVDQLDSDLVDMELDLGDARAEVKQLRAELADAARSGWIVARDGGRDCVRCDREIRRGEAYELLAGADELAHVHCPPRERPTNPRCPIDPGCRRDHLERKET